MGSIRVELDDARESMQKKIRNAQLQKIPYMLVVGDKEAEQGAVSVRLRNGQDLGSLSLPDFIGRINEKVASKAADL
jgi:threonyl-tRNA synthetase